MGFLRAPSVVFEPRRDISTAILGTGIETKDLEGTERDVPEVNQRFNFCLGSPIRPFPRPGKQQLMRQSRQLKLLPRQIEILRRNLFRDIISPVVMSLSLPVYTDHPTARARQLTCILYGRISSPIPIFATLASIFSVHTILISHSKNSSCDRIKSKSLFSCRWKLGVKKNRPIHSPSIRGSTVAEAHFIPNAPSATLAGTWKLPPGSLEFALSLPLDGDGK